MNPHHDVTHDELAARRKVRQMRDFDAYMDHLFDAYIELITEARPIADARGVGIRVVAERRDNQQIGWVAYADPSVPKGEIR